MKTCERFEEHSKELPPLQERDSVFIQNQSRAHGNPNKWDREGIIIQTGEHDQCLVLAMELGEFPYVIGGFSASSPDDRIQNTLLRPLYLLLKIPCQSTPERSLRLSRLKLIQKQTDQAGKMAAPQSKMPHLKPNPEGEHDTVRDPSLQAKPYPSYLIYQMK